MDDVLRVAATTDDAIVSMAAIAPVAARDELLDALRALAARSALAHLAVDDRLPG